MREETASEIINMLACYNGSECIYRHWIGGAYTDGVKAMAEACSAYWLIDLIFSHQVDAESIAKIPDRAFQLWEFVVTGENEGQATCSDGGAGPNGEETKVIMQEIPYTDFPLDAIKFYFIDGLLMLPSEY